MTAKNKYLRWIFLPETKATVSVLTTVITGFLSSALITQITNEKGELIWKSVTKFYTFYIVCGLVLASIVYNFFTAGEEISYRKRVNDSLLENFIEKEGINTLASEINTAIKNGDKPQLNNLMEMKDILTQNLGKK
jgi:hypothetical protein